jgi:hypothetical protein
VATNLSLVISLLFGIGQIAGGGAVVWWLLARRRAGEPRTFMLLLIASWFICSGIAELFVSGMEIAHQVSGQPPVPAVDMWRGRADAALLLVTLALVAALPTYLVVRRLFADRG